MCGDASFLTYGASWTPVFCVWGDQKSSWGRFFPSGNLFFRKYQRIKMCGDYGNIVWGSRKQVFLWGRTKYCVGCGELSTSVFLKLFFVWDGFVCASETGVYKYVTLLVERERRCYKQNKQITIYQPIYKIDILAPMKNR